MRALAPAVSIKMSDRPFNPMEPGALLARMFHRVPSESVETPPDPGRSTDWPGAARGSAPAAWTR